MNVKTEKDCADAINRGEEKITIEGDLVKKIKRLRMINETLWAVCLISLGIAVAALLAMPVTAGASILPASFISGPAVSILGLPSATSCVSLAVAGGGVGILKKLRNNYEITYIDEEHAILYLTK